MQSPPPDSHPHLQDFPSLFWVLRSRLLLKMTAATLFFTGFMAVYFWLQHHHLGVRYVVSPGWADELIPFHPGWSWPYLMLYFLTTLSALCLETVQEIRAWWLASLVMGVPAWVAFCFCQTEYPRPLPGTEPWPWLYEAIIKTDAPLNVTPCLHSAFALLSAWGANRTFLRCRCSVVLRIGLWCLTGLVILGIVGTRQHRLLDILVSLPLPVLGAWVFLRLWRGKGARLTESAPLSA